MEVMSGSLWPWDWRVILLGHYPQIRGNTFEENMFCLGRRTALRVIWWRRCILKIEGARVEDGEVTEQLRLLVQYEITALWRAAKEKLNQVHTRGDINRIIFQVCEDWLGGKREGWVAKVSWAGDGQEQQQVQQQEHQREHQQEEEMGPQGGRRAEIERDYQLHFHEWTKVDPREPL
ncbi:hypothetical protein CBR_g19780 [Chara braunii]|uniref:Uncharacterized protein n=1 Tax=Chara braunii TaxID=69332 RepID=A0A388JTW4_CHABU|nr:hypothetical protein CBR_g19780 [Chara braunii]|eukprot:GBG61248.1 hypothetical protein CBR_g19780 [Chara braunii]